MHSLMRRLVPAVLAASAALAVVVLADPALRAAPSSPTAGTSLAAESGATPNGATSSDGSSPAGSASSDSSSTQSEPTTQTFTGPVVQTRWGPVQVVASVANGVVTAADAAVTPGGHRESVEINAWAVPVLNDEAVRLGSAQIDTVTGATVTSDGYRQSLQSILDGLS